MSRSSLRRITAVVPALALPLASPGQAGAQGHAPEPGYQDDRSTAEAVIGSYYDAINRQEYAPFHPMAIEQAAIVQVDDDADTATLMGQSCPPV